MSTKMYLVQFGTDNPANYTGITPTFVKFFNSAGSATTAPSISEIASSGLFGFTYNPQGFIGFIVDGTASLGANVRYVAGALDPNDLVVDTGTSLIAMGASLIAMGNTVSVIGFSSAIMGNSLAVFGASMAIMGNSMAAMGVSLTAMGSSLNTFSASMAIMGNSMAIMGNSLSVMGGSLTAQGNTISSLGFFGTSLIALGNTVAAGASLMGVAGSSFGDSSTDPSTLFGFMRRIQELQEGDSIFTKGTGVWAISSRGSSTLLRSKTIADSGTTVTKV